MFFVICVNAYGIVRVSLILYNMFIKLMYNTFTEKMLPCTKKSLEDNFLVLIVTKNFFGVIIQQENFVLVKKILFLTCVLKISFFSYYEKRSCHFLPNVQNEVDSTEEKNSIHTTGGSKECLRS